jgi:hypothetical protein
MRISPTKDTQWMENGSLSICRSNDNVVVVIIVVVVVVYRVGLSSFCRINQNHRGHGCGEESGDGRMKKMINYFFILFGPLPPEEIGAPANPDFRPRQGVCTEYWWLRVKGTEYYNGF